MPLKNRNENMCDIYLLSKVYLKSALTGPEIIKKIVVAMLKKRRHHF